MSHLRELLTTVLLLGVTLAARAETVVTACGTDTAGGGTNLAAALAAGGDIRIACAGGPNEIRLTLTRTVPNATTIDGNGATLIGPGNGAMFSLNGALPLVLRNLALRNPFLDPGDPNHFTGIVYDARDVNVVELTNVTVTDTRLPFAVRRLVARDSRFERNGDPENPDFGVVMAGDLELQNVAFRDNASRPIHALWRGDPIAKKQKIAARLIGCTFERNKRPLVWAAGDLIIESSTFTDNGDAVPYAPSGRGSLYGGLIFLELAPSMAGAVEVVLGRATISRSTFKGNHGMLGGAVLAWRGSLTLQSTDFDANRAVSAGAVAYLSPEGTGSLASNLRMHLAHVKLRDNEAAKDGGALMVLGAVTGDAVQMSRNEAGETGGALVVVSAAASPKEAVPAVLGAELPTTNPQPNTVELMRTFVLDNSAAQHAVDAGDAGLRFGNSLFARNIATSAGGAAIDAQDIELVNSTVIGNQGAGVRIEPGGTRGVRITNAILADNDAGNCTGAVASLAVAGANLQYPDAVCAAAIAVADPALDSSFAPSMFSPARDAGTAATCATHDLVAGRDLYGKARGPSCAIGAVEADLMEDVIDHVGAESFPWLLLWMLIFLLICFIVGFIVGVCRRRRKKKA